MRSVLVLCGLFIGIAVQGSLFAASAQDQLMNSVKQTIKDREALFASIRRGNQKAMLCQFCHGRDGNGARPEVPKLAGQSPIYLVRQFVNFEGGHRKSRMMEDIAPGLTSQDRVDLALYFASLPTLPNRNKVAKGSAAGEALYQKHCASCHRTNATGDDDIPRLAGQQPVFLRNTLLAIKEGRRSRPLRPEMVAAVKKLSTKEISQIIDHLAAMKEK